MTDREKLIELQKSNCKSGKPCAEDCWICMADHLIANGVTFAKDTNGPSWIPVTERLPEDDLPKGSKKKQIKVLTALISDKGVRTVRSQMRYRMTWYNSAPWAWKYSGSEITHWMPLPEAPKEVE